VCKGKARVLEVKVESDKNNKMKEKESSARASGGFQKGKLLGAEEWQRENLPQKGQQKGMYSRLKITSKGL